MRASIWIGWAGTVAVGARWRIPDWPGGSYESVLPLSFSTDDPRRLHRRSAHGAPDVDTDLPPLAEEAAVDRDDRRRRACSAW